MHSSILVAIFATTATVSAATCRPGYAKAGSDEGVRCYSVQCDKSIRGDYIGQKPGRNIRECVKKCYNFYNCDSVGFEKETNLCLFYDGNPKFHKNAAYDGALLLDDVDQCF